MRPVDTKEDNTKIGGRAHDAAILLRSPQAQDRIAHSSTSKFAKGMRTDLQCYGDNVIDE